MARAGNVFTQILKIRGVLITDNLCGFRTVDLFELHDYFWRYGGNG